MTCIRRAFDPMSLILNMHISRKGVNPMRWEDVASVWLRLPESWNGNLPGALASARSWSGRTRVSI